MKISKVRIKNYRSIKDSGDIHFTDKFFVLAGQNESGKSSILEALNSYEEGKSEKDNLNFELENSGNLIQEISVTYTELEQEFFSDNLDKILELIENENKDLGKLELTTVFNEDHYFKIEEFTITRTYNFKIDKPLITLQLDKNTISKLVGCIKKYDAVELDTNGISKTIKKSYLDPVTRGPELAQIFWSHTLKILLFDDFTTLLPDKILLTDIESKKAEGYEAVENLEKLLSTSFKTISLKKTPQKISTTEAESNQLSINFQEDWQQRIYGNNEVNLKFFIENNDLGEKEISFYIETKDNEFLAPRRRSKGMIWFLSLWLELKSKENLDKLVLLFDEPGLHLHIKANMDMLKVFHKLIEKGHQIIYSTHSPSLIETDRLHNIGLVINDKKDGTTVENLTTSKINSSNKKDALQPISQAMGMEPLKDFSILKERNVLLEGLSDFWYLKGMSKLLRSKINYEFIPGIGIKGNKINHLISFCLGYGLNWLLVMDNGELPQLLREELKKELFFDNEKETLQKIKLISVDEIENIFSPNDILLVDSSLKLDIHKSVVELIGVKRKILFSKMFYQKVLNNEIKKNQLHPDTIYAFEEIFKWIESQFSSK